MYSLCFYESCVLRACRRGGLTTVSLRWKATSGSRSFMARPSRLFTPSWTPLRWLSCPASRLSLETTSAPVLWPRLSWSDIFRFCEHMSRLCAGVHVLELCIIFILHYIVLYRFCSAENHSLYCFKLGKTGSSCRRHRDKFSDIQDNKSIMQRLFV